MLTPFRSNLPDGGMITCVRGRAEHAQDAFAPQTANETHTVSETKRIALKASIAHANPGEMP